MEGEPEWKTFNFKMVTIADLDQVETHLRQYYKPDEPLHVAFWRENEWNKDYFRKLVIGLLEQDLSFIALDNTTGKVAGVYLLARFHKHIDSHMPAPPLTDPILRFVAEIDEDQDLFGIYGVEQYGEIFIASVSTECRGQGLAKEMYRRGICILKNTGDTLVTSLTTSPFTRRICASLNFEELKTWKFSEAKDNDGSRLLKDMNLDGVITLQALKL